MDNTIRGTQAASRALRLLRLISTAHPEGVGLEALSRQAQLDRATAYRLATCLVQFGFVERDEARDYRLGMEAMQLGLAAMRSAPIVDRVKSIMKRLARRTEDTIFLVVRNGDYAHCLHCEEGTYPVKAMVLRVGGMRVLGIGSAGSTLLAMLSDEDIESLYKRHIDEFRSSFPSLGRLQRLVVETRRRGYADTADLVTEGVSGVGMRFELSTGTSAAISVAAIRSRMSQERKDWMAELIAQELRNDGLKPSMSSVA